MPEHSRAQARPFRLRLLGRWQLLADGEVVGLGHREERLTALLGLTGPSSRPRVAGVLWPESTESRALASLRRAVLQTQQRCPGLLRADRVSIGLDRAVEVDVDEVRRAAAATEDAIAEGGARALLGQLVGEELLSDWYDDWVLPERERIDQLRVKALERIARQSLEAGDPVLAVDAAHAASDIDPLLESAGELAIRAHLGRGDLGSALREFDRYRDAVRRELGVPPSRAILELIEPALAQSRVAEDRRPGNAREAAQPAPAAPPLTPAAAPSPESAAAPPAALPAAPPVARPAKPALVPPAASVPPVPPVTATRAVRRKRQGLEMPAAVAAVVRAAAANPPARPADPAPARPREPVVSTVRGVVVVRLLGVAALILAAALATAGVGPLRDGGGRTASGDTGASSAARASRGTASGATVPGQMRVLPADRVIRPSRMIVRLLDAAAGRAAFLVRTTAQPALVRLEVRGDTGRNIVRSVLVRSPQGRRLELSGLRPGSYRWMATSSVASASGRLRVAAPALAVGPDEGTTIEAAAAPSTGGPTDEPTAAAASTSQASSEASQPRQTKRPDTSGRPKDPGTRPPTPVG